MARVPQITIDKGRKTIGDFMSSPAFPSSRELLESNTELYNVVRNIIARGGSIPAKTICGLLVEALDIGNAVTGEALWKRYRRVTANRDGSEINKDKGLPQVRTRNRTNNSNRDRFQANGDASQGLFIPPTISQTDLAAAITEFFRSRGYTSAALLKTCLMAMDGMPSRMEVSEMIAAIDARYRPQDSCETENTKP